MSSIGSNNVGAFNLAGSIAGTQKNKSSQVNESKAEAAVQKFQLDQKTLAERATDVAATDMSSDRDADGRSDLYAPEAHDELVIEEEVVKEEEGSSKPDRKEAGLDTGQILDLEA